MTEETRIALEYWGEKTRSIPVVLKRAEQVRAEIESQAEQVRAEIESQAETMRNVINAVLDSTSSKTARGLTMLAG